MFSVMSWAAAWVRDSVGLLVSLVVKAITTFISTTWATVLLITNSILSTIHFVFSSVWFIVSHVVSTVLSMTSFVVKTILSIPGEVISFVYHHFALVTLLVLCVPPLLAYLYIQNQNNNKKVTYANSQPNTPRGQRQPVTSYDNAAKMTSSR